MSTSRLPGSLTLLDRGMRGDRGVCGCEGCVKGCITSQKNKNYVDKPFLFTTVPQGSAYSKPSAIGHS